MAMGPNCCQRIFADAGQQFLAGDMADAAAASLPMVFWVWSSASRTNR